MPANTSIILPLHVRSDHLARVVAKLMQVPCQQRSFDQTHWETDSAGNRQEIKEPAPFDGSQPSSAHNSWFVEFDKTQMPAYTQDGWNCPLYRSDLVFQDPTGTKHAWPFFSEPEDEKGKSLLPDMDALALAIGWRLVTFFGGEVYPQPDKGHFVVDARQGLYPVRQADQTADERWYQFQNALQALPALTSDYLKRASARPGMITSASTQALEQFLVAREAETSLEAVLPHPDTAAARKPGPRM